MRHRMSPLVARMRSADRIELRLSLEAERKTSTRDEYFAKAKLAVRQMLVGAGRPRRIGALRHLEH
jgi:hypothetical protein